MNSWSEQRKAAVDAVMRETINRAAVRVLIHSGLGGVTMDRVASEAGVAKGTIYNYYQNKEELLLATYREVIRPIKEKAELIFGSDVPPEEKLKAVILESIRFCEENRSTLALFEETAYGHREDWGEREGFVGLIKALIDDGVRRGTFRPQNTRRAAEMLLGVIISFFEFRIHRDESVDVEAEFHEIWGFFSRALFRRDRQ